MVMIHWQKKEIVHHIKKTCQLQRRIIPLCSLEFFSFTLNTFHKLQDSSGLNGYIHSPKMIKACMDTITTTSGMNKDVKTIVHSSNCRQSKQKSAVCLNTKESSIYNITTRWMFMRVDNKRCLLGNERLNKIDICLG